MIAGATTVGVVGAGTMGQGIAQTCASAGYKVLLYDLDPRSASKAREKISAALESLVQKGKIALSAANAMLNRIEVKEYLPDLRCDFVIEAVIEDLAVKQNIFKDLESFCHESATLLTNTSSIEIGRIAQVLKYPGRFAGLHFFNPAPVMKLVEIVKGPQTDRETVDRIREFSSSIGKFAVITQDSPGFIVNRVARLFYVEALKTLEEEVASYETIDALMRNAGFRMGPFELMDLIGIDVNLSVTKSIYDAFKHERFRPGNIQQQKVDAGLLGRKSRKGFYDYSEK